MKIVSNTKQVTSFQLVILGIKDIVHKVMKRLNPGRQGKGDLYKILSGPLKSHPGREGNFTDLDSGGVVWGLILAPLDT